MSLAEQLVVVALLGGLGSWGLTMGQEKRQRQKVEAVAGDLLAGIQLARAEAERRQLACGLSLDRGGWQEPVDGSLPACARGLKRFGDAVTASRHATAASVRSARMMQTMQSAEEILAFALRQRGHAGDDDEALALLALEEPRRREPLAVLRQRAPAHGPGGEPHIDVDADLAETFLVTLHQTDAFSDKADVDVLFAASIGVLGALDRLWCRQPPMFGAYELLRTRTVFEAGAYVGRVLVKQGGAWQKATPVTSSTVLLGGRVVDPFQIAWDALFTFKPLGRSVQECRS